MDAEIAGNDRSNDDHTDDGEDAHAAPSFHFGLGELGCHYAFTLVDVIGSA
jgi:hypothetical protein